MTSMMIKPARISWVHGVRIAVLVAVVVGSGALAVQGTHAYIERELDRQRVASRPAAPRTVAVVVAKYPLERGESIGSDNMAVREVPADFLPTSAIQPDQFDALAGMRLSRAMRGGEPLLREALAEAGPEPLATRLAVGKRAVTIVADEVNSVSGMLRPGDRIDLLLTARDAASPAPGGGADLTRPLLQDVRILATGAQLESGSPRASGGATFGTITVEVSPEQAKQLVLAQRGGRLTALLRGPDDRLEIGAGTLEFAELLGRSRPAAAKPALAPVQRPSMEIIVGGVGRPTPPPAAPLESPRQTPAVLFGEPSGSVTPPAPARSVEFATPQPQTGRADDFARHQAQAGRAENAARQSVQTVTVGHAEWPAQASTPLSHRDRGVDTGWGRVLPVAAEPMLIR